MWRSKPLSLKIWSQKWKRVYWIPLLFGRTLKHSHHISFEEKLTSYLQGIHASPFQMLETEKELKTQDTSTHTSPEQLTLFDQTSVSSKTSEDTSPSASEKSLSRWKEWVTECVGEYSVRRKRAQAIREKEYLSWQSDRTSWKTPIANQTGTTNEGFIEKLHQQVQNWATPKANGANSPGVHGQGVRIYKTMVVMNWPTPTTMENEHDQAKFEARAARLKSRNNGKSGTKYSGNGAGPNLATLVSWPTPTTAEANKIPNVANYGQKGLSNHPSIVGETTREKKFKDRKDQLHDPDKFSTNGSDLEQFRMLRKRLNPHWVCQLMGTDFEKIFFVHLETPCTQTHQS